MKLFSKFVITILASVVIGLGGLSLFAFLSIESILQGQTGIHQLDNAQRTVRQMDQFLYERSVDITSLAGRTEYIRAVAVPAGEPSAVASTSLRRFKTVATPWANLGILDTAGLLRGSTTDAVIGKNPYISNANLAALYHQALAGKTVYSDVYTDPTEGKPVVTFMVPISDGKTNVGVLSGDVAWNSVAEVVKSITTSEAYVLNRDGLVIAGNRAVGAADPFQRKLGSTKAFSHMRAAASGTTITDDFSQPEERAIVSYAVEPGHQNYHGNGWYVALSTTAVNAFAPARPFVTGALAILFGCVIIGVGLIFLLMYRHVIRPIKVLAGAIARVKLGDLSQTVAVASDDEVGQLGRDFNDMVRQLAATHQTLSQTTQAADEGRAQLESSINGLRQGFIITDRKGKSLLANAAAKKLIASARAESPIKSRGRLTIEQLASFLPVDVQLIQNVHKTLDNREQSKFTNLALGGRFLNIYLSPVVNENTVIGAVLLLEDVTEERILQRSRDEFFSIASHELRTPLTAIRGNTSLIRQYFPQTLKDPAMDEMVSDIHESAVRLIGIVNDFLDASRIEQNKMKFDIQPFLLEGIIEGIIYEMSTLSREKEIGLSFDQNTLGKLPPVLGDLNRVKQVIYNLLGNAMKFTKQGSVTVNCLVHSDYVKICVTDTGPGMSPEGQQLLFHKFQQTGESIITRDNARGTGLGLYISKLLVEHMHGEIRLEHTEIGKGSTFSFTLPIAKGATAQAVADGSKASQLKPPSAT